MSGEADILFWIHDHLSCGFLDFLMPAVSLLCTANIMWFMFALLLIRKKETRRIGVILIIALIVSIIICNLFLKPMVGRIRPYNVYDVTLLVPANMEYSFPSGHTTGVTVVTTIVCMYFRKWMWPMILFALTVMFSRMYLFMHYPTDILGGILVGIVSVILSHAIVKGIEMHRAGKVEDGIQRV